MLVMILFYVCYINLKTTLWCKYYLLFTFHKWRNWDLERWTKFLSHITIILQTHAIINSLVLYLLLFKTMSVAYSLNMYMNHFKSLLKHSFLCSMLRNSESQGERRLRIFVSNKLKDDADAAGPSTTLWEPLVLLWGYWKILGQKPKQCLLFTPWKF